MSVLRKLRAAAQASPIEHELKCPRGHVVRLEGGRWLCAKYGVECTEPFETTDLVRSGRTRARQFHTYPEPEPWR